jgi:hypothetical protein
MSNKTKGFTSVELLATAMLVTMFVLTLPQAVQAEVELGPDSQVFAFDSNAYDNFGCSVSIGGGYAAIGACRDESNTGCAYIFQQDASGGWIQTTKLVASDVGPDSRFGYSVSISDDYVVVGGSCNTNAAYIFQRNGVNWTQMAKLTAATGSCFGEDVFISGDYVIVGSRGENGHTGAAYIFQRNGENWTQVARLTDPNGNINDYFGGSVAISGDYAVVGAFNDGVPYYNAGSVCFFHRNGDNWEYMSKLNASDAAKQDQFGWSSAIDGNYAVVGSIGDDDTEDWGGAVYVFHRDDTEWAEVAKLTVPDADNSDGLGWSVSISGNNVIASTASLALGNKNAKSYIFHRDGDDWGLLETFKTCDRSSWSTSYAAVDREKILVGMIGNNVNGTYAGAAYFTSVPYPDGDITEDRRVNFQDFAALVRYWSNDISGLPDETAHRADLVEDDFIDGADLCALLENWLECTLDCD